MQWGKKEKMFPCVRQEFPHNRQSFSNYLKCQRPCKRLLWLIQTYWTQSTAAAWSFYWMTDVFLGVGLRTFCFLSSPASCFLRDSLALHLKGYCYWTVNHRQTFLPGCPLQNARGPSRNNYNCCLQGGHWLWEQSPEEDEETRDAETSADGLDSVCWNNAFIQILLNCTFQRMTGLGWQLEHYRLLLQRLEYVTNACIHQNHKCIRTHAWVGLFTPLCNERLSYLCLSSPHIFTCPLRRETAVQHTLCPPASLFSYSIMVSGSCISFLSLAVSFKNIMLLSSKSTK